MHKHKAMFGISVFKRSITNDVIAQIAQYLQANARQYMIVLVDEPEVHNWLLRGRASKTHAGQVVDRTAEQRENAIRRVLRKCDTPMPVHRWKFVSSKPLYRQNLAAVRDFYKSNPAFRVDIQKRLQEYLGAQIDQTESRLTRKLTQNERDESAQFLIEEIAGLAYMHFDLGFGVDVYPDKSNQLIYDLFTGVKYGRLGKSLRVDSSKYRYVIYPKAGKAAAA